MAEQGEPLSPREQDVLESMAHGATNREIAESLIISPNTVKVHLRNIYSKLGVSTRTEAMRIALEQGLLAPIADSENGQTAEDANDQEIAADLSTAAASPSVTSAAELSASQTTAPSRARAATQSAFAWRKWLAPAILTVMGIVALLYFGTQLLPSLAGTSPAVEPFPTVEIDASRWFTSRPLPQPRAGMTAAVVGLNLYAIAGEIDGEISDSVTVLDSATLSWREATNKPTAVVGASAAVLEGEIYVPGGQTEQGATNVVEIYSPANDAWRTTASLPQPVQGALTLSDGSFIYVIGGESGGIRDEVMLYDPGMGSWRPLQALPTPRAHAAGGFLRGKLYVVGGENESGTLAVCEAFDVATGAWEECPPMLEARSRAGAVVLNNNLYVFGGESENGQGESYNPTSGTWQVVNMPMLAGDTDWTRLAVSNVETRIFALGGVRGEGVTDEAYIYAPLVRIYLPSAPSE
jgi:DNA-binding CsgD family transcriptional regulator/N-acetylneuraminic acid mutarotase